MKNYKEFILLLALALFISSLKAQTINWASLKEDNRHIINANAGMEYGVIYGLGYGYQFKSKLFPIIANVEYSSPSGSTFFDDFKTKMGVQLRWLKIHDFQFSTKIQGIFRRYENDFVRLLNFGSDLSANIGYYRSKWFIAGEVGFDKTIITNFKHSNKYRDQYPGVVDGWYEPATGGNFYYGLQAGYSFKNQDLYLKAGKLLRQDFKSAPYIPFYVQIGYNIKL